jgi:L-rhamnose-H+ transport protein
MRDILGFLLTVIGGVSVGMNMWPLKWARRLKWENFWLIYAVVSLIIIPFALAFSILPHLGEVYSHANRVDLAVPFFLGTIWGFAQLGAGVSAHRLGFAVGGGILSSIGVASGTLLPLIFLHRSEIFQPSGILILASTFTMFVGAWLCARSGYLREEEEKKLGRGAGFEVEQVAMRQVSYSRRVYTISLGIAVGTGILASLLNFALALGGNIEEAVVAHGGSASMAPFAVWPLALLGASIVNIGHPVILITRNRGWGLFKGSIAELFFPALAGLLWMGGIAIYSSGTTYLGLLGVSIGFAVYMITATLVGQLIGVVTGEWKGMPSSTYRAFIIGIVLLVIAVLMVASSRYFSL